MNKLMIKHLQSHSWYVKINVIGNNNICWFKDASPVSLRSELFTSYILTIFLAVKPPGLNMSICQI